MAAPRCGAKCSTLTAVHLHQRGRQRKSTTSTDTSELVQQKSRIKVTSISPGVVRTEFLEGMSGDDKDLIRQLPYLRPEAVADAIVYVLSTDPTVQITELTIRPVGEPI
ncbi:unnamed protein product [Tenebrio molitor]|uniref:Uncharacterized protein n=1 Tax=Tenebrio molitor TaxID=7067 RepID=A0A8J6HR46_TENMO|nr:hypothetical protein GEV33_003669 [Tenebrio molitor]CAH1382404.1 unnamed protein product [Tenebrio molitor]